MTRQRDYCFVLVLLVLAVTATGCASIGYRPTEPPVTTIIAPPAGSPAGTPPATLKACEEYQGYARYAQQLQEAYHTRASQNRGWIYVAGILGLAVAAASGGLAAATAVGAGTIGLLTLSGGFAAGSFAAVNNESLALSYTVAANSVDEALKTARQQHRDPNNSDTFTPASCAAALTILVVAVSDARTHLEVARTDNAAGAMARAKDQLKLLNEQVAAVEAADITKITLAPQIASLVTVPAPISPSQDTVVTLTVHAKLGGVGVGDLRVALGDKLVLPVDAIAQLQAADPYIYEVKVTVPKNTATGKYKPVLLVKGKTRIESKSGVEIDYP